MKISSMLSALFFVAAPLLAEPVTFESGEPPTMLVELFSSEGCSSCPSADAWVSKLKGRADLWKRVVPVVFQVDYWNGLGWTDRYATAANTARQRRYAAAWHGDSVYTPGFVLNGQEWRGWFKSDILPEPSTAKVGKLTVTLSNGRAEIGFVPIAPAPKALQVELALLGSNLETNVRSGENGGRKLRHDFTVLSFATTPLHNEGGRFTASVPIAAKTVVAPSAVAAWVTPGDAQPPLQATGGWLRTP